MNPPNVTIPNPVLQKPREAVAAEIAKIENYLMKLKAIGEAMDTAMQSPPPLALDAGKVTEKRPKAPTGSLKAAILGVLAKVKAPASNEVIRHALASAGYEHSMTQLHVSKTLTKLVRTKQAVRVGEGTNCAYVLGRKQVKK